MVWFSLTGHSRKNQCRATDSDEPASVCLNGAIGNFFSAYGDAVGVGWDGKSG